MMVSWKCGRVSILRNPGTWESVCLQTWRRHIFWQLSIVFYLFCPIWPAPRQVIGSFDLMPCAARMSVSATEGSRLSEASDDRSNTYPNTFVFEHDPYLIHAAVTSWVATVKANGCKYYSYQRIQKSSYLLVWHPCSLGIFQNQRISAELWVLFNFTAFTIVYCSLWESSPQAPFYLWEE